MALIEAPKTFPTKLFINNEFVDAADGRTFDRLDPLTGAATWLEDMQRMSLVGGVQDIVRIPSAAREPTDVDCEPGVFPDVDSRG